MWLLLTGAGLVAETVVIVALGCAATARYDAEETGRSASRPDDQAVLVQGRGAVRAASD
jgi:hypothetical protein